MNQDTVSLDQLRDIVQPERVSWWPPAPGWWFLTALLLIAASWAAVTARRRRASGAGRRDALRELETAITVRQINEILKRTALSSYPRSEVASLAGQQWIDWLTKTGGRPLAASVRRLIATDQFRHPQSAEISGFRQFADTWIRTHAEGERC